jgi:hypothetical protein
MGGMLLERAFFEIKSHLEVTILPGDGNSICKVTDEVSLELISKRPQAFYDRSIAFLSVFKRPFNFLTLFNSK